MASIRDLSVGRSGEIYFFNPHNIKEIEGFNPRDYDSPEVKEHIQRMANAIVENGIMAIDPITVQQKNGELYVLRGHCRRRAFILAEEMGAVFKGIRAYVDSNSTEEDKTLDLLNSNSGLPLTLLEKSTVIKRLFAFGWSVQDVAKKLGVSVSAVNHMVILDNAPEPVKAMVKNGEVSSTLAIETIQERGNEGASEVLETAVESAKSKGKSKATAKDLKESSPLKEVENKIQKVRISPSKSEGIAKHILRDTALKDRFELDAAAGDFPCSLCMNRDNIKVCKTCMHYLETDNE